MLFTNSELVVGFVSKPTIKSTFDPADPTHPLFLAFPPGFRWHESDPLEAFAVMGMYRDRSIDALVFHSSSRIRTCLSTPFRAPTVQP